MLSFADISQTMNKRPYSLIFISLCWLIVLACNQPPMEETRQIDLQGHRGCRGLMPENTIPAFLKAIDIGVNTLELGCGHYQR